MRRIHLGIALCFLATSLVCSAQLIPNRPAPPSRPQEVLLLFSGSRADERILVTMNNNHVTPLAVSATLYTVSGQPIVLPTFNLLGNESRLVELTPILQAAGLGNQELGWLKLDYTGGYLNFGAQLTLYPTAGGVGVDSTRSISTDFKSRDRYSAFWMPEGGIAKIAVSNPSDTGIHVKMQCGKVDEDFVVPANGTKVKTMSIEDLNGLFPLPVTPASCRVTSDAAVSTLRVVGTIKAKSGYAAPIRFYDPATATASSLSAVGIETSAETHVIVKNLTDQPIIFTPVVTEATLNEPKQFQLEHQILLPQSTIAISLARGLAQLNRAGIDRATVTLKTDAPNGAWVGSLTQIAASDGLIEDIPLRTANRPRNAAGFYPLRWDGDYTNLVTVTNTSNAVRIARAMITTGGITYVLKDREIQPGSTAVYDVDTIRAAGTKDMNGLVLPLAATYGKFIWFDSSLGSKLGLMGRNSVVSQTSRRKSSFSCGGDCGYTEVLYPSFSNNPFQYTTSGGSFGGDISQLTALSGGAVLSYPYPFSFTGLASSNTDVLNYTAGSSTSFIATAGSVGSVTASYNYEIIYADYDEFGDCTPDDYGYTAAGDAGTDPTVTITYTGGDGTPINGTSQNVVVGQQIALTANYTLPSGITVASQSWSIPGTTVQTYSAAVGGASSTPTVLNQQNTLYAWLDPGSSRTVTFQLNLSDGRNVPATVNFNVVAPSVSVTTSRDTAIIGHDSAGNPAIRFGHFPTTPGITFSSTVTAPSGYSGSLSWVQLITSLGAQFTYASSPSTLTCTFGLGLDNQYPYSTTASTNDSPASPFRENSVPDDPIGATDTFGATMYLLWQPAVSSSIPVPLGHVNWGYSATVSSYIALSNTGSISSTSFSNFVADTSYPTWNSISTGVPSCH